MDDLVERVKYELADIVANGFDNMHRDVRHWHETMGMLNGTFRYAGDLTQCDIEQAARAIIPLIRDDALEDAAKVADNEGASLDSNDHIAAAIRAMKGQPNDG